MSKVRPTVACVVLTKNEAVNLERCLASVAWCAEHVVVDSGSTDRTREVAESLGARFQVHVQSGAFNIAEQRNWALTSTGIASDWVLFLDADEEVTPALRIAIEKELAAGAKVNAYELTPRYLFWGTWLRYTQGFPNWHARLVRRGVAGFAGGVWEHFDSRASIGRIAEPYNHFANSKGLSDWLARHDRYSTWDAEMIVAFLETNNPKALGTERKVGLRLWAARLYPLRPFARFIQTYFGRLGFLEGMPALVFCLLYFFYELMTVVKVIELKRIKSGKPL
jgi:glycosyltransferase involved in cell wall biosynthesis